MKILTWLISLLACAVIWTASASAQCTRHFYNNSDYPFRVGLTGGLCNGSPLCTVAPHRTATIVYLMMPGGSFNVSSIIGGGAFGMSGCYIYHRGNTGVIAVNSPADGDVTTCGNSGWQCPSPPRGLRSRRKS